MGVKQTKSNFTASQLMANFLYETTTGLNDIDFWNKTMQFDNDATSIASGEATAIYATPPVFKSYASIDFSKFCVPIGGAQNYSLNEGMQTIPFPELGSVIKRTIIGSTNYSASISRLLTLHSDLYYSCYSWLPGFMHAITKGSVDNTKDLILDLAQPPGESGHRHFVSMDSELLKLPFGLLCVTGSASGDVIHVEVLERCYIQGGGASRAAGNPMVIDGCSISVTRPVPFINSSGSSTFPIKELSKKQAYTLKAPFSV